MLPGELSEIGGEFWGELVSALGTEAAAEVLGVETWELLGKTKTQTNSHGWARVEWYNNVRRRLREQRIDHTRTTSS